MIAFPKPHMLRETLAVQYGTYVYLPVNMQMTIERAKRLIPDWGERRITLAELYDLCDMLGFHVLEYKGFEIICGITVWERTGIYILINASLSDDMKVITLAHEYCHAATHMPSERDCKTLERVNELYNERKMEHQASVVGTIALMPRRDIVGKTLHELLDQYDVKREVVEFRAELNF